MLNIKHPEFDDPNNSKFDHVAQAIRDIRELRERHDRELRERQASRFSPDRRVRSTEANIAKKETIPLFFFTLDHPDSQSTDQDAKHQDTRDQDAEHQDSLHQDISRQDSSDQDSKRQEALHQDPAHQDDWHQDDWQQAALEADRERMDAVVSPTITKATLKKGILATSVLFALLALFVLEKHRIPTANAGASLTAAQPTISDSRGDLVAAPGQITAPPAAPVTTAEVAPTREAIAAAYQNALQSQPPEIPQPSSAPAATTGPSRIDPDEVAALQKPAQDRDILFKQFLAWEAAQNAKAQARPAQ